MKSPERPRCTTAFLAITSLAWLAMIHGVAFFIFEVSLLAAWAVVAGHAATIGVMIAYLAWEFRQSKPVPTVEPATPVQDINLLMLTRSAHSPMPSRQRRTRTRLTACHPLTDRIVSLHRPPHLDRRIRKPMSEPELAMIPLAEFSRRNRRVMPSAN